MNKKNNQKAELLPKSLPPVPTRSPFVYLTPETMAKLEAYINLAEGEISGLGLVERHGERDFLVTELYLLKQKCSGSETTLDVDALAQFAFEFVQDGGDMGCLKLWWHSHANFGVSWSPDDERTIQGFQNDWLLSIVGNKSGSYLARVDVFSPVRVTDRDLLIRPFRPLNEEQMKQIEAEIAEKVTFETPKPAVTYKYIAPSPQGVLLPKEDDWWWEEEGGL